MAMLPVTRRERSLLGVGVAAWVCLWLVLGLLTAAQIRRLSGLSETVVESGEALDAAGRALEALGDLPVVGGGRPPGWVTGYAARRATSRLAAGRAGRRSTG